MAQPRSKLDDPLEVKLALQVKNCRTCKFFWPTASKPAYGPYPTYDFKENFPKQIKSATKPASGFPWIKGVTGQSGFPDPEIVDGCRKAPIMTLGINPNLTAALPETTGAAWAYPVFGDVGSSNGFTKYAWYYRYRTVDQEHFAPSFIKPYLLEQGQVHASADGKVISIDETSESSGIVLVVEYNDGTQHKFTLKWSPGAPRYVVLTNAFKQGDLLAARLNVTADKPVTIYHEQQSYYERLVPVLKEFSTFLHSKGHSAADLMVGDDVCQLDMVACASPHWGPPWLGGTNKSEAVIVNNCVSVNAWAVKQLIQTQPSLLILVGQPSYEMFNAAFGKWITSAKPLPANPADGAFTLVRQTADPKTPAYVEFTYSAGGKNYVLKTRLVVSPHFSYTENFYPQFRLSPAQAASLSKSYASCAAFLKKNPDVSYVAPMNKGDYAAFELVRNAKATFSTLQSKYPDALKALQPGYVSANALLYSVMADMYESHALSWTTGKNGGYLSRNEGSCQFCINRHWHFPAGCAYGKTQLPPPPAGFLEAAAAAFVKGGKQRS